MSPENRNTIKGLLIGLTFFLIVGSFFYGSFLYGRHYIIKFIFSNEFPLLGLVVGAAVGATGAVLFYSSRLDRSSVSDFYFLLAFVLLAMGCTWLLALRLFGI